MFSEYIKNKLDCLPTIVYLVEIIIRHFNRDSRPMYVINQIQIRIQSQVIK